MEYKLVIGVDVSKKTFDVTGIAIGSNEFPHDSFLNHAVGFKAFKKWISKFGFKNDEVLVCMEHTGYYMFALCEILQNEGINYSAVNPLQIKKSMGIQRVKSDKQDSKLIALYASKFTEDLPIGQIPKNELMQLKVLVSHRERLLKETLAFEKVNEELESTLTKKLIKEVVKDNESIIKLLRKRLKNIELTIQDLIASIPMLQVNYELMQTIPGVGPQIALYVLLYTHNFDRITTPRKFGCFAGVVPNSRTSGTSLRGPDRVSYLANKKMKSLLHFGALSAIRHDHELKKYVERKLAEGKSKMSVINAVRNKLVHRIYSVVKRGTPYVNKQLISMG